VRRLKGPGRNTHETECNFAKFSRLCLGIFCTHSTYIKQSVTGQQWVQKQGAGGEAMGTETGSGRGGNGYRNREREERQ
jgi:hypothetical protein